MSLNAKIFWDSIEKILIEDGISVHELATKSGLQYSGLIKIRDGQTRYVRHATVRDIAEATGRKFVIDGDKVTFIKQERNIDDSLAREERRLLALYRELGSEDQDDVLNFVETLCKMLERKKMRGATGKED
jgi:hypothetical protein